MLEDVFSVQRDVAERASASLALGVLPPADSLSASQTKSRAARNAYLKARHFRDQGTEEGFYRAIDYGGSASGGQPIGVADQESGRAQRLPESPARELNPISKGAAANLAMQLVNTGRLEEAAAAIAEAMSSMPDFGARVGCSVTCI